MRFAEHGNDIVRHGARHRAGVDAAGLHRRWIHDDRADFAIFVDTQAKDGVVAEQSPAAGQQVKRGSRVTVSIGKFDPNLGQDGGTTGATGTTGTP